MKKSSRHLLVFIVLCGVCCGKSIQALNNGSPNGQDHITYRLPNHTRPETYDISIKTRIDLLQFEFSGLVKIGILVIETTQKVVLHSRRSSILSLRLIRLTNGQPEKVPIQRFVLDEKLDFLVIDTDNVNLNIGDQLRLDIAYSGFLKDVPYGFYRTSYKNPDNTET